MDQVRLVLNVLWTQRFWVLSVVGLIASSVCWNMGTSQLDEEFTKRKNSINSAFNNVNQIKRETTHPNKNVNAGDLNQARKQREIVLNEWKALYEAQRTEVTKWPEDLPAEFIEYMENRKLKFGDNINSDNRGFYWNFIKTRFDGLLEIVDAEKIANSRSRGGSTRGGVGFSDGGLIGLGARGLQPDSETQIVEEEHLVQWLDQDKLQEKLAFETSKPSSMEVWVTQEDLWVYETLLNVIANTNRARGATRPDNTAVRAIIELQVGSEAADSRNAGKILFPDVVGGNLPGVSSRGRVAGRSGAAGADVYSSGGRGGRGGLAAGAADADDAELVANRYLDPEGNVVQVTPGSFGSTEFRKLPIHMSLLMDQRWIPHVLIECANAALPVEVKQLRINPEKSEAGFEGKSTFSRSASQSLRGLKLDASLAKVEIFGVVYIYNQPDPAVLAIPGDEAIVADAAN